MDQTTSTGMPAHGLGEIGTLVPAAGRRENARGRLTAKKEQPAGAVVADN